MKKFDIYEEVTNRIIKKLEQGIIPWQRPWTAPKGKKVTPSANVAFNRVTKIVYSALNQMLLSQTGEYATFKQWQDLGGHIKKGAKAEIVVFWKQYIIKEEEIDETTGEKKERITKVPVLKYYQVFHISDVEGIKPLELKEEEELVAETFDPFEDAEQIINAYQARENIKIYFGGDQAFYSPALDYIQLPTRQQFGENKAEFYSTAFHEITHSTGAKHRLDRLVPACFGCSDYAREELVAEIGACGILHQLGIETDSSFRNSTAYIQSWLKKLRNDKKLIVFASSRAEKAIQYILTGSSEEAEEIDE